MLILLPCLMLKGCVINYIICLAGQTERQLSKLTKWWRTSILKKRTIQWPTSFPIHVQPLCKRTACAVPITSECHVRRLCLPLHITAMHSVITSVYQSDIVGRRVKGCRWTQQKWTISTYGIDTKEEYI